MAYTDRRKIFRSLGIKMKYCFVCLFNAKVSASGLAFRVVRLWEFLNKNHEDIYLIANKSLVIKVLGKEFKSKNLIVINDGILGFRVGSAVFSLVYLPYFIAKGVSKFHLTAGAAYFAPIIKKISENFPSLNMKLHTSLGSRNIHMASHGVEKYIKLHEKLIKSVDKIDCIYPVDGFEFGQEKFILAPGSFSWRFPSVDNGIFKFSPRKRSNIVFSGSLLPQKNGRLAIESFICMVEQYEFEGVNLLVHAPSVPIEILEIIADCREDIRDRIIFRDESQYVEDLTDSAYFMSLQSVDNYPSQSLLEAMLAGCSIIASDVGDTRLLVHSENGNLLLNLAKDNVCKKIYEFIHKTPGFNENNYNLVLEKHSLQIYACKFYENFILQN